MIKVNPYLNFEGKAEEAFNFYRSVFGGEFSSVFRMKDAPGAENFSEEQKNGMMHISLPISDTVTLMASDITPGMGQTLKQGNTAYISLHPDTREEASRLFKELSLGGKVEMPIEDTFWGDYFGCFEDKFGIHWMVNHSNQ